MLYRAECHARVPSYQLERKVAEYPKSIAYWKDEAAKPYCEALRKHFISNAVGLLLALEGIKTELAERSAGRSRRIA